MREAFDRRVSSGAAGPVIPPDRVYADLDNKIVRRGRECWRIHVFGVFDLGAVRWVQAELLGATRHVMTVRVTGCDSAGEIRRALVEHLHELQDDALSIGPTIN